MSDSDSLVYTVDQLVQVLQRGRRQLYEDIEAGRIPGVIRLGRSIRVSRHAIDAWLDNGAQHERGAHSPNGTTPEGSLREIEEAPWKAQPQS